MYGVIILGSILLYAWQRSSHAVPGESADRRAPGVTEKVGDRNSPLRYEFIVRQFPRLQVRVDILIDGASNQDATRLISSSTNYLIPILTSTSCLAYSTSRSFLYGLVRPRILTTATRSFEPAAE